MNRKWDRLWDMPWFRFYCLGIVVILFLAGMKLPSAYYHRYYQMEEFECSTGDVKGYNFYVDEELASQGELFLTCPKMYLDKGRYHVTVSYGADKPGNYLAFETDVHPETVKSQKRYDLPETGDWGTKELTLDLEGYTEGLDLNVYYGGSGELTIYEVTVDGLDWKPWDILAITFFVLLFYILAGVVFVRMGKEKFCIFAALSLTAILSSYPYFSGALREGYDIDFHLTRIVGIKEGLLAGQFPVRVYPGAYFGAGYDCGLYYPDLFLYFPGILCLLGVSVTVSVQIFGVLLHFLAAFIMYYSIRKMGGNGTAGLLGSIAYVLCEYLACNFYLRTDFGESIAMCFFPLVICGFYTAVVKEEKDWKPLCLGMTGLVLSHVLSTLFAAALLLVFCLFFWKRMIQRETVITCLKAAVTSLGLCCWFLVPFFRVFRDREVTNISKMAMSTNDNALEFYRAFVSIEKEFPWTLGISLTLGGIFCLYCLFAAETPVPELVKNRVLILLAAGFGLTGCTTSAFPWDYLMGNDLFRDLVSLVQFPCRLLGPASAFVAMAVGLAASEICRKGFREGVFALFFAVSFFSLLNLCSGLGEEYIYYGETIRDTQPAEDYLFQLTDTNKLKDIKPEVSGDGIELLEYEKKNGNVDMEVSASAGSYVDITLLFFTGHKAFDKDGKELPCVLGENNRMRVQFPADYTGEVRVRYTGFPVWRVFDLISLFTLFGWISVWIIKARRGARN